MSNISLDNLKLIHSKYYLNTQAEEKIKIDIVWETKDKNHALDYKILGVYFENKMTLRIPLIICRAIVGIGKNGWLILVL